jgi:hypothetical protein
VILGRGAAIVLGKGRGFHVRLDGPPQARVVQGAAIEGISVDQARRHLEAADRARDTYVRRLYRTDPADPRHYHLVIDSTALPLDAVTELILRALSASPGSLGAVRFPWSARGRAVLRRCGPVEFPRFRRAQAVTEHACSGRTDAAEQILPSGNITEH